MSENAENAKTDHALVIDDVKNALEVCDLFIRQCREDRRQSFSVGCFCQVRDILRNTLATLDFGDFNNEGRDRDGH